MSLGGALDASPVMELQEVCLVYILLQNSRLPPKSDKMTDCACADERDIGTQTERVSLTIDR